jgi:flagellar protein FliO/FliZ
LSPFSEDCVLLSIPGTEALSPAVKYVIAFAIIFLLLALFALVLRRLTGGRLSLPSHERGRSRQPRLGIVDVYDLDRQRQLILLRRDNVEHLLLIGGPNDVVVETNLVRTPGARLPHSPMDQTADRPESFERTLEAPARPLIEPQRPEPVVARLGPVDPTRGGAEPRNGPTAMPAEVILKPDVVALSPAPPPAPPRPAPQREPPPQPVRDPPPLQAVREPAPPVREPAPPPPPVQRAAPLRQPPPREPPPLEPPVLRPVPEPVRQPAPPPARQEASGGDAAVLSNMAKQLEEALKRPLSTGKPGPGAVPHPNGPAPTFEERGPRGAPAPSGRPLQPVPAPLAPPAQGTGRPVEPVEAPRPRPVPAPVTRMRPAPEPEAPPPPPPPEPPASPGADQQSDPFSVEEIEAEFARLLGRPLDRGERPH